jgi:hypothetical protein
MLQHHGSRDRCRQRRDGKIDRSGASFCPSTQLRKEKTAKPSERADNAADCANCGREVIWDVAEYRSHANTESHSCRESKGDGNRHR